MTSTRPGRDVPRETSRATSPGGQVGLPHGSARLGHGHRPGLGWSDVESLEDVGLATDDEVTLPGLPSSRARPDPCWQPSPLRHTAADGC